MKRPRQQLFPREETSKITRQACQSCSFVDQSLSWRLSIMDMEGPFGWQRLRGRDIFWSDIFPKLQQFETMTWQEIIGNRHHAISIDNLSKEALERLSLLRLDDIEEVFSLALTGRNRIIGIRDRNIFRVLWWDPDHQVCPSHKKHT